MALLSRRFIYFEISRSHSDIDYSKIPLQFEVLTNGKILWKGSGSKQIKYSKNGGSWTTITSSSSGTEIPVSAKDIIQIKSTNNNGYNNNMFVVSDGATFNAYGNAMSLVNEDDWLNLTTFPNANGFFGHLFEGCSGLISVCNLILPATTLTSGCYNTMFKNCTRLIDTPILPATTLAQNCYNTMFQGCTSLTAAPALPATTLFYNCYYQMFSGCTNLITAPTLPATTLAEGCYRAMFDGCTKLVNAPELPATTLDVSCYHDMFKNCSSLAACPELSATTLANYCYCGMFYMCTTLTAAPDLPATTLAPNCYRGMFRNCTSLVKAPDLLASTLVNGCYMQMFNNDSSLNYIRCTASDISASDCLSGWTSNVSQTGTFIKNANTNWTSGQNGIPTNWTVQDDS